MEYSWDSRKKLAEACEEAWRKEKRESLPLLTEEQKKILEEMAHWSSWGPVQDKALYQAAQRFDGSMKPSEFMKRHYGQLVECCVPKPLLGDYYAYIDKYNQFQYAAGMGRRSMRSPSYRPFMVRVFLLLQTYRGLGFFGVSVIDYLKKQLPEELLDLMKTSYAPRMYEFEDCLAARIDAGDEEVRQAIREIIFSENNASAVTVDIIRAIVKSSDGELHRLLCDLLLAARLQEGVRQAICENADCGCMEAFLRIIDTIEKNDLLRFSAVKRAVATWTGVCSIEHMDRITEKVFGDIVLAVHDRRQACAMTKSDDSVRIMIGLWALGAWNIMDALAVMEEYVKEGSRNQRLTMSYFNIGLGNGYFASVTAKKMLEAYPDDFEMAAAFLPTYMQDFPSLVWDAAAVKREKGIYGRITVSDLYLSREEAYRHFALLMGLYRSMPKKKMEFSPCVFPWYGVVLTKGALIERMAVLAFALNEDGLIDQVCPELVNMGTESGGGRGRYVDMLLETPDTPIQRECLIGYVADRETMSREAAYEIADKLELTGEEYRRLEGFLKYKDGGIRQNVLALLGKQEKAQILESAERLLSNKAEEMRLGALDLLRSVKKEDADETWNARIRELLEGVSAPTPKEKILIDEIGGRGNADEIAQKEGFGLYDPAVNRKLPEEKADLKAVQSFFALPKKELDRIFNGLNAFLAEHGMLEYRDLTGNECLLCNGLRRIQREDGRRPVHECYPFPELWRAFYDTWIKTPQVLWNLYFAVLPGMQPQHIENYALYAAYEKKLFSDLSEYVLPDSKYAQNGLWSSTLMTVLNIMCSMAEASIPENVAKQAILYITQEMPEEALWYETVKGTYSYMSEKKRSFLYASKVNKLVDSVGEWKDDEAFAGMFWLSYRLDQRFGFGKEEKSRSGAVYGGNRSDKKLTMADYVKAYTLGMIEADSVYRAAFEEIGVRDAVDQLGVLVKEKLTPYDKKRYRAFLTDGERDPQSAVFKAGSQFYLRIVDTILDVELKRGDSPTVFSESICAIRRIYGAERLIAILTALGKESLDRKTYYGFYGRSDGKRECLSYLLQVCWPKKEDSPERLGELQKDSQIPEERLIETAMYAPQWLDILEEYLGWNGLKSGCYYFMAHMNERFDDRKAAMIAKYTPLTKEELNDGAFDVDWFWDAYRELGEKRFDQLYRAAKYISDGSKHSRARKYADAALERTGLDELEKAVMEKRNKDTLMSCGIVPVKGTEDLLHRYEFLQKFLKESRQFGAQRRASEGRAVEMAMKNLATAAGYSDVTRLTLAMETQLVKANARYLEGIAVGEYGFQIVIDASGNAELEITKGGKKQKAVPAALKKNEEVLAISGFKKKLKEQYSRTVKMFEQGMEESEIYSFGELKNLCENPVAKAVLERLVWVCGRGIGVLTDRGLTDVSRAAGHLCDETAEAAGAVKETGAQAGVLSLEEEDSLRVAHPWDLYQSGKWPRFQRYFFDLCRTENIRQPFKQVFRELYVKLLEETEKEVSLLFAGNQIQPQKTAACLKGRRWIADVEEGLQKIYYKENIIAGIYALADWFSPADVEAPTLEYVVFYDRKTFRQLKIAEVPDIIYSEVMRDVDLAVSVAHAGGVDPESSHSTVEMRRVIARFNAELFGLKNVTFEKNHAVIRGSRASYSIHLGSGVIHQLGAHQINVLPVHSQSRGKVFLPFVDEDPKTAEIMSKILLFAQDNKIKDPYILDQIGG